MDFERSGVCAEVSPSIAFWRTIAGSSQVAAPGTARRLGGMRVVSTGKRCIRRAFVPGNTRPGHNVSGIARCDQRARIAVLRDSRNPTRRPEGLSANRVGVARAHHRGNSEPRRRAAKKDSFPVHASQALWSSFQCVRWRTGKFGFGRKRFATDQSVGAPAGAERSFHGSKHWTGT